MRRIVGQEKCASGSKPEPKEVAIGLNERGKIDGKPKAKSRNFMPRREADGTWALSTFCIDGLDDDARWARLQLHNTKPLLGRCELQLQAFREEELLADPDWNPEGHVNILGWPVDEEVRKNISQRLYAVQRFVGRGNYAASG